jgi:muramoyltetrapeptide carboxypeptidase
MKILKPHALKKGDVIGICAPASAIENTGRFDRGVRYLERLGYRVELGKNIFRRRGYLAGTDRQRADDINALFRNKQVKAIFAARGGYGCQRLLPLIDYRIVRANPKILVGYSDITALHLGIFAKTGLVGFSGPMVASDFGKKFDGPAEERFWRSVTSTHHLPPIEASRPVRLASPIQTVSSGRILGGNLSLVASAVGTPYFPSIGGILLLLEEIDERPYRIDRLLQQMSLAGLFRRTSGLVLGTFVGCTPQKGKSSLSLHQMFAEIFSKYPHPVASEIRYGHIRNSLTVPIGITARIEPRQNRVVFTEPALAR